MRADACVKVPAPNTELPCLHPHNVLWSLSASWQVSRGQSCFYKRDIESHVLLTTKTVSCVGSSSKTLYRHSRKPTRMMVWYSMEVLPKEV